MKNKVSYNNTILKACKAEKRMLNALVRSKLNYCCNYFLRVTPHLILSNLQCKDSLVNIAVWDHNVPRYDAHTKRFSLLTPHQQHCIFKTTSYYTNPYKHTCPKYYSPLNTPVILMVWYLMMHFPRLWKCSLLWLTSSFCLLHQDIWSDTSTTSPAPHAAASASTMCQSHPWPCTGIPCIPIN